MIRQFVLRQGAKLPKGFISWHAPLVIKGILNKPDLIPYEDIELWPGVTLREGIPYVSYSDGSAGFNPTTIAQYGLIASTKQDVKSFRKWQIGYLRIKVATDLGCMTFDTKIRFSA